jgi:hypothetical protein
LDWTRLKGQGRNTGGWCDRWRWPRSEAVGFGLPAGGAGVHAVRDCQRPTGWGKLWPPGRLGRAGAGTMVVRPTGGANRPSSGTHARISPWRGRDTDLFRADPAGPAFYRCLARGSFGGRFRTLARGSRASPCGRAYTVSWRAGSWACSAGAGEVLVRWQPANQLTAYPEY